MFSNDKILSSYNTNCNWQELMGILEMQTSAAAFHQSRHLNDNQLLLPDSACPFCGSDCRQTVFTLQDNPQISLLKCGVFYARTPCMLPLIKFLKNLRIKIDFSFPGHIHDLGQAFWESYLHQAISCGDLILLESNPSFVETTFKRHFFRTLASYLFKAPWYLLGRRYTLVGGWEIFIKKTSRNRIEILQK